jgi:hypothetical protein
MVAYRNNVKYNYCKKTNRVLLGQFEVTTKRFVKIMAGSKMKLFVKRVNVLESFNSLLLKASSIPRRPEYRLQGNFCY